MNNEFAPFSQATYLDGSMDEKTYHITFPKTTDGCNAAAYTNIPSRSLIMLSTDSANCTVTQGVLAAQAAGAVAVIVCDVLGEYYLENVLQGPSDGITIPVVEIAGDGAIDTCDAIQTKPTTAKLNRVDDAPAPSVEIQFSYFKDDTTSQGSDRAY